MSEPQSPPPKRPHPLERRTPDPPAEPSPPRRGVPVPTARPVVTYALLASIILIYFAQQAAPNLTVQFLKWNDAIIQRGEYYRLFTAMFLHGSIAHLFFNSYALYVIGTTVEQLFGAPRFALIYFLGGLTGSIASLVFTPAPSLGASGAIFALLGAEGVFFYAHREAFGQYARSRLGNIVIIAVINLALGFLADSLIDNWGHIGGLFGGVVLTWFIGPRLMLEQDMIGGPFQVVDRNPLQRTWLAAALFAGGLVLVFLYVIASWS